MKLVIESRAGRGTGAVGLGSREVVGAEAVAAETRQLAKILGWPVEQVRENLVCGVTLQTASAFYTLVD